MSITPRHPRVLFIGHFFSAKTGTRSNAEDVSGHLTTAGWTILTTSHHRKRIPRILDMVATVVRKRRLYEVAVVDVYSGFAFAWAELVCALLVWLRKPVVLVLRGGGLPQFSRVHSRRVHRLLAAVNVVVTPSHFVRGSFLRFRGDIRYFPNGIDIGTYNFKLRTVPAPKLVWLRAFHAIYNPGLAVTVLAHLLSEYAEATLTMIGPDKGDGSLQKVKRLAARQGIREQLRIVGKVPKRAVPAWLSSGDIFLNTPNYESFGVAVMEAAASGLGIVTTEVGELPYLWRDGEDALLVPPDDPAAMAAATRRLLSEPGLAEKLSRKARKRAEQFDWINVLPHWEDGLSSGKLGMVHFPEEIG